jgi:hypothetical protein
VAIGSAWPTPIAGPERTLADVDRCDKTVNGGGAPAWADDPPGRAVSPTTTVAGRECDRTKTLTRRDVTPAPQSMAALGVHAGPSRRTSQLRRYETRRTGVVPGIRVGAASVQNGHAYIGISSRQIASRALSFVPGASM